jgi:hypothetical protein
MRQHGYSEQEMSQFSLMPQHQEYAQQRMRQQQAQQQAQYGISYTNQPANSAAKTALPSMIIPGDKLCQNAGVNSMSLDIATPSLFSSPIGSVARITQLSSTSSAFTQQAAGTDRVGADCLVPDDLTSDWYYHANEPGPSTMKRRVDSGLGGNPDIKESWVAVSSNDADMEVPYVGNGKGKMGEGVEIICID